MIIMVPATAFLLNIADQPTRKIFIIAQQLCYCTNNEHTTQFQICQLLSPVYPTYMLYHPVRL